MPGGRINTNDKLAPWKADPTRSMLPREPNYAKDAEAFREKLDAKRDKKRKKDELEKVKKQGRGESTFVIRDLNFIIKYSTYKGKQLGYVLKKDPEFIRNMVKSGDYSISESVRAALIKRGVIKS
jgi:hypothetical protein